MQKLLCIQSAFGRPIDLPENFEFTFYLKAESPSNNFEIKFLDSTGQNVWWVNNRNYDFPKEWKKIKIKRVSQIFTDSHTQTITPFLNLGSHYFKYTLGIYLRQFLNLQNIMTPGLSLAGLGDFHGKVNIS